MFLKFSLLSGKKNFVGKWPKLGIVFSKNIPLKLIAVFVVNTTGILSKKKSAKKQLWNEAARPLLKDFAKQDSCANFPAERSPIAAGPVCQIFCS